MKECSVLPMVESRGEASQGAIGGKHNHQRTCKRGGNGTVDVKGL
jgi:hypothetical protein